MSKFPHKQVPSDHRREYLRNYMRAYRKKNKSQRVSLSFTPEEFTYLKARADSQHLRPSRYLREVYRAFHADERLLPPQVQDDFLCMMVQLRGAANNLNQIARHLNIEARGHSWFGTGSSSMDPEYARQAILDLEKPVAEFLKRWQR
jgi:hypothetical protein